MVSTTRAPTAAAGWPRSASRTPTSSHSSARTRWSLASSSGDSDGGAAGVDSAADRDRISDQLERWLQGEGSKTLGGLIEVFEEKSFALLFVLLLGVPALPLPTGGATHVFEVIAVLLALELIAGRE